MKKNKVYKLIICVLCAMLLATVVEIPTLNSVQTVQAATKGLKKKGKYYYYYSKGKPVKNKWVKIKNADGTFKYYFDKKGRAYAAPNLKKKMGYTCNVVLKKIGKYSYGFDSKGHMVTDGYYNDPNKYNKNMDAETYYFDKNGRYNKAKSTAIQKAGAYQADAKKLRRILGEPLSEEKLESCPPEPGFDYQLTYETVYVTIHRYPEGNETVYGIFPR